VNAQADFADGQILFTEVPYKPPDAWRLQAGMFMDRPDLWPTRNGRRRSKPPPPEQQPLFPEAPPWS
jgi:hypothetical protein